LEARSCASLLDRRLGAALVASLAVHVAGLSLSLPAPRVSPFEPTQVLEVSLRKVAEPPAVLPEEIGLAPAAPVAEQRARPERRRHEPVPRARKNEPSAPSPAGSIEEEQVPAPAPEARVDSTAPPPRLALTPPEAIALTPRVSASELLVSYGQTISQALARYKEYPRIAQMQGWQGAVTMRLRVAPSGRLIDAEVHSSSGHEVLDRQALAMASKPERYPVPPEGLRDREVAVLVPVVFRLER
jgi:protein TonB